jgi:zinc protease
VTRAHLAPVALLLLSAAPLRAQTSLPAARVSADSATVAFQVLGLPVILRRVTANTVVAANLYLLGGAQQISPTTAGIEPLLLEASGAGTRRYSQDGLRRAMARLGSEILVQPTEDWTLFGLRSTTDGFDSTWAIFADRLLHPRLDSIGVDLVRTRMFSGARQRDDSPDALVRVLADSQLYRNHPYGVPVTGTASSLTSLRASDVRRYAKTQLVTSRMLLVVVGNVDQAHLARLVRATIAQLPRGEYRWSPPPAPAVDHDTVLFAERVLPTNYVVGYYAGPPAGSADIPAMRVATAVLSGALFSEIRSKRNLSYAVDAPWIEHASTAGGLYVSTVAPDRTLRLMYDEVRALQTQLVDAGSLDQLVQQFITEYFLDNETNSDQATFLARAWLYRGDFRAADRFVDDLRRVTPQDVQRVARLYMQHLQFGYVGDSTKVSRALFDAF